MESENLETLEVGDSHYKAYVGPPLKFDLIGAMQFKYLTNCGLRDYHKLLDIGCGSLRLGRLMIPFLKKGNYFGTEPNKWLIEEGLQKELGKGIIEIKSPSFNYSADFDLKGFNESFDFIIAQSIFTHASSHQISKCLKEVKSVIATKGIFLATFFLGEENYEGSDWVYPGITKYTPDYILGLIRNEGLDAIKTEWSHPRRQTWYIVFNPDNRNYIQQILRNFYPTTPSKITLKDYLKTKKILNNRSFYNTPQI